MQRNPEAKRRGILDAALEEFALQGIDGARTERIARAAKVNKALLYYYFKSKDELYAAVLRHVFGALFLSLDSALDREVDPAEKLLAYVEAYFDFVAASPRWPRMVMGEMMRAGAKPSPQMLKIFETKARPVMEKFVRTVEAGIKAGSIRRVDPFQIPQTVIGTVVFYFISTDMYCMMTGRDPLSPKSLKARRDFVVELISNALLTDRAGKAKR